MTKLLFRNVNGSGKVTLEKPDELARRGSPTAQMFSHLLGGKLAILEKSS
jgi:hypothetical protein